MRITKAWRKKQFAIARSWRNNRRQFCERQRFAQLALELGGLHYVRGPKCDEDWGQCSTFEPGDDLLFCKRCHKRWTLHFQVPLA